MDLWYRILEFLETEMERPVSYGWFHWLWLAIVAGLTVLLCTRYRNCRPETVRRVVFLTAVVVALLEVYKQLIYSFDPENGRIIFDFQWYAFPWQFCSMPMYVGLLTGVFRKGKIHDALYAFLATYAVFAGICVMVYPNDVFTDPIGINIQTMVCHGSMIVIGLWLLATGSVKIEHRTILGALAVFAAAVGIAVLMNELAYHTGITGDETFNMFFISQHYEPSLPVYSIVQELLPFPWCLVIYVAAFTMAAYLILLAGMLLRSPAKSKVSATV